ncbi:MAG: Rrf2 family nitric oxide-sensitive transcriptional repressor [Rhodothermales bacterium]|jgi:Rrf2 family nitric oxide-sensitive transcriptional repressor
MHLTTHTDFALRLLIHLQVAPASVSVAEVATAYGISRNHLAKVALELTKLGWIESKRGRGGGLNALPETSALTVGTVVRSLEPLAIVECHRESGNTCPIEPACKLKGVLHEATSAFLAVLDGYTIGSLARRPELLRSLLQPPREG